MTKTQIYLGLTDKDGVDLKEYALDKVLHTLKVLEIHGATVFNAYGVWRGFSEHCFIVELWDETETKTAELATFLKNRFNQETVSITRQDIKLNFV